jgi:hypothetical protein
MAPEQLATAERLLSRVTPGERSVRVKADAGLQVIATGAGLVVSGVRTAGDADFIVGAPELMRLLLAEVGWLAAELADVRGVLAKTLDNMTALAAGGDLTVYRAERAGIPLGTYLSRDAAQGHCLVDLFENTGDPVSEVSWWTADLGGPTVAPYTLSARVAGEFQETTCRVVPVHVLAEYDPDGEA